MRLQRVPERGVVGHGAPGGVEQQLAGAHPAESRGVDEVPGCVLPLRRERDVQAYDVAPVQEFVEPHEAAASLPAGARRVAQQHPHAEQGADAGYAGAHVAGADHPEGQSAGVEPAAAQQHREHRGGVLLHRGGIAAGGVLPDYSAGVAPRGVDMVEAYGRGGYDPDARAFEKGGVAAGAGAGQQGVGVPDLLRAGSGSGEVDHLRPGLEHPADEGYPVVADYLHFAAASR